VVRCVHNQTVARWIVVAGGFALLAVLAAACGDAQQPSAAHRATSTTGKVTVRLAAGGVTVTPWTGLHDGQQVEVNVKGFPPGWKVHLSECLTPFEANELGCGSQLAAQAFGLSDQAGNGSIPFVVHSSAGTSPNSSTLAPCSGQCVIVATSGVPVGTAKGTYYMAPIMFSNSTPTSPTVTPTSAASALLACSASELTMTATPQSPSYNWGDTMQVVIELSKSTGPACYVLFGAFTSGDPGGGCYPDVTLHFFDANVSGSNALLGPFLHQCLPTSRIVSPGTPLVLEVVAPLQCGASAPNCGVSHDGVETWDGRVEWQLASSQNLGVNFQVEVVTSPAASTTTTALTPQPSSTSTSTSTSTTQTTS